MYAEAGQEVRAGNGLLTQVFGPSAYEEGAIFYEAQRRVAEAQSAWAAREDELKILPAGEVARQWADHLEAAKVGDQFLDQVVSDDLLKSAPSMLQSVAKAAYKYDQELAVKSQSAAWLANGDAFQAVAESFAVTADPDQDQITGYNTATQNFLNMFIPVKGQTEESYVKNFTNTLRMFGQRGNGHAVTALMRSGASNILSPDALIKVDDMYQRYGQVAISKAAASEQTAILQLDYDVEWGKVGAETALKRKRAINERLKRRSGFDIDYYDPEDLAGTGRSIMKEAKRLAERADDIAQQEADREDRQRHDKEMKEAQALLDASLADQAWGAANPAEAAARLGVKEDVLAQRGYSAYASGDFSGMEQAWRSGVPSVRTVKDNLQNTIASQVSDFNEQQFSQVAGKFQGMMGASPALAKEYFGPAFAPMRQYVKILATGGKPATAFAQAFGNDYVYQPSGASIAKANKDMRDYVAGKQPGWFGRAFGGSYPLSKDAQNVLANLLAREVAQDAGASGQDLTDDDLKDAAIARITANGMFETAGPLGWSNLDGLNRPVVGRSGPSPRLIKELSPDPLERLDFRVRGPLSEGYAARNVKPLTAIYAVLSKRHFPGDPPRVAAVSGKHIVLEQIAQQKAVAHVSFHIEVKTALSIRRPTTTKAAKDSHLLFWP